VIFREGELAGRNPDKENAYEKWKSHWSVDDRVLRCVGVRGELVGEGYGRKRMRKEK